MPEFVNVRATLQEALAVLDEMGAWVSAVHLATAIDKLPQERANYQAQSRPVLRDLSEREVSRGEGRTTAGKAEHV